MPPKAEPTAVSRLGRHRQLAPNANVKVSPLCLGTMTFGDKQQETYGEITKSAAMDILDYFYDHGGNFIDTANVYQLGQSEEWIGEWMRVRGNRDEIVLATKYSGHFPTEKKRIRSNLGGNGSKSLRSNLEASLKRLGTDYIDLYYVHWWDYATSIPELMHSLNDLVVAGKVLYLGISDTPAWIVSKANEYARQKGLRPFVIYQGFWNAGLRDMERDILPMCRAEGMGIAPYGVLGQGRFQTTVGYVDREHNNPGRKFIAVSERDRNVSRVLEEISSNKTCSLLNVALAYVMQKTPYVFPIIGLRKVDHLKGSMDGLGVYLSDEDIGKIENAYEFDHGFPHTFLSGTMLFGGQPTTATSASEVWLNKPFGPFDWVDETKAIRPFQQ